MINPIVNNPEMVSDIGLTTLLQLVTKDLYLFFAVCDPQKKTEKTSNEPVSVAVR